MSTDIYYQRDVSSDSELLKRLKEEINNWANSMTSHPYKNLGDKIEVLSVKEMPFYEVGLKTQYETRSKKYAEEPYGGGSLPERKFYNLDQVNVWEEVLNPVIDFANTDYKFYKKGSQYIEDCHKCNASGYIDCPSCGGTGDNVCSECNGSKKEKCSKCGGEGESKCSSCNGIGTITKKETCYACGGTGRDKSDNYCGHCCGAGRFVEEKSCSRCYGNGYEDCYYCKGEGEVDCKKCGGNGYLTCSSCNGAKKITCPTCKGYTKLMKFIQIEQSLNFKENLLLDFHHMAMMKYPPLITKEVSYETTNLFRITKEQFKKEDAPQGTKLDSTIESIIEKSNSKPSFLGKILFQEFEINKVDVWVLKYSFNGNSYEIAFHGNHYEVIHKRSPISDFKFNLFWDAKRAIREKKYITARNILLECNDIDINEQKESVEESLFEVEEKISQTYKFGASAASFISLVVFGFISFAYYTDINYVFNWFDFLNTPKNFLYDVHPWTMVIITSLLILAYKPSAGRMSTKIFGYNVKAPLRFIYGFFSGVICATIVTTVIILLNFTGLTFILSFIGWIVMWVVKIIYMLIAGLVSLIIWIIGLFT